MIKVLVNKKHGGFSLSPEAIIILAKRKSDIISQTSFQEFFGKEHLTQDDVDEIDTVDMGDGYFSDAWGTVYHPDTEMVISVNRSNGDMLIDDNILLRTHPDMINLFEEIGDKMSGKFARLGIVEIYDEDVSLKDLTIDEYDGAEWVSEKHRTWS